MIQVLQGVSDFVLQQVAHVKLKVGNIEWENITNELQIRKILLIPNKKKKKKETHVYTLNLKKNPVNMFLACNMRNSIQ